MSSYFEETDRANLSPVFVDYYAIINHTFCTQPKTKTMAYEIYKSIFIQKRESITVISKMHQNSFQDPLHFSVNVVVVNNWTHTLHYNGMWDGNAFFVDNITVLGPGGFIETIAQF
jgi:hypothetical protein